MGAPITHHSSTCAAARRHKYRRSCRSKRGQLDIASVDVAARLLAEGVPAADLYLVAAEVERCIRVMDQDGDDEIYLRLNPATIELIERYGDKLATVLMTTRGKVRR